MLPGKKFPKQNGRYRRGIFMSCTKKRLQSNISTLQASAVETAKDFKSRRPFFIVPMQQTYASGMYMVTFCITFYTTIFLFTQKKKTYFLFLFLYLLFGKLNKLINPFVSFVYVRTQNIPTSFVDKYLGDKHTNFKIRDLEGRTWPVEYVYQRTGRPRGKLKSGWKKFLCDNDVQVGDVCVFELINDKAAACSTLQVHVYPSRSTWEFTAFSRTPSSY